MDKMDLPDSAVEGLETVKGIIKTHHSAVIGWTAWFSDEPGFWQTGNTEAEATENLQADFRRALILHENTSR